MCEIAIFEIVKFEITMFTDAHDSSADTVLKIVVSCNTYVSIFFILQKRHEYIMKKKQFFME